MKVKWIGIIPLIKVVLGIHRCNPNLWNKFEVDFTDNGSAAYVSKLYVTSMFCPGCGKITTDTKKVDYLKAR